MTPPTTGTAATASNVEPDHSESIFEVIRRTLEPANPTAGTPADTGDIAWAECPVWPPDLFAVVATIVDLAGCHTQADRVGGSAATHGAYIDEVMTAAIKWRHDVSIAPDEVYDWWDEILVNRHTTIGALHRDPETNAFVIGLLLRLLATADEACVGIGWSASGSSNAAEVCLGSFALGAAGVAAGLGPPLPHVRHSLCRRVSPYVCTVLPKALTTPVGCTLRSLSHHLALLPPITVLKPKWLLTDDVPGATESVPSQKKSLRLLVLPFPFRVDDTSFTEALKFTALPHNAKMQPYFEVGQTWLTYDTAPVTSAQLFEKLFVPLLESAQRMSPSEAVDGILLPECALDTQRAGELGEMLAQESGRFGLKFFICGAMAPGDRPRNLAMNWVFGARNPAGQPTFTRGAQAKHHRWALDRAQIDRYGIIGLSDADASKWWEHIDVSQRKLPFFAVRNDLCMTVLICEDLARADPAMQIVRSIGPNLVVALLMDGPQLAQRWPGRYATVLAEDPGSSVLSITCAGMVDRSNLLERNPVRAVGLWRHENGPMQELYLPQGHHGLLLSIDSTTEAQHALDHRTDGQSTNRLKLKTIKPLALDTVPDWL